MGPRAWLVYLAGIVYQGYLLALKLAGQVCKSWTLALREFLWPAGDETDTCLHQMHPVLLSRSWRHLWECLLKSEEEILYTNCCKKVMSFKICIVVVAMGMRSRVCVQAHTRQNGCWLRCYLQNLPSTWHILCLLAVLRPRLVLHSSLEQWRLALGQWHLALLLPHPARQTHCWATQLSS